MGKERGEWKLYLLHYPRSFVSFYGGIFCWLFRLSPLAFNHRTNERTEQPTSEPISPPFRTGWNSATKFRKVSPREKSKTLESSRVFLCWHIFPRRKKDCHRLPKRSITKFLGSIVSYKSMRYRTNSKLSRENCFSCSQLHMWSIFIAVHGISVIPAVVLTTTTATSYSV